MRTSAIAVALLGIALVVPPAGSATAAKPSEHDLYLSFNGPTDGPPNLASSGSAPVQSSIASVDGGTVAAVRHKDAGRAARFEPFDAEAPTPLAVVVVRPDGSADPFSPGRRSFTFGAAFKLDAQSQGSDVDNGNNLVQRGLYGDAAQYKLQIDGNRLSCRVSGSAGAIAVNAASELTPGRWHRARCTRTDGVVTLVLVERTSDGRTKHTWRRSGSIGRLTFAATTPLSVGGKVNSSGKVQASSSDQFNGRVDNVFFRRTGG